MICLKTDTSTLDATQLKMILDRIDRLEKCKKRLDSIKRLKRHRKMKALLAKYLRLK